MNYTDKAHKWLDIKESRILKGYECGVLMFAAYLDSLESMVQPIHREDPLDKQPEPHVHKWASQMPRFMGDIYRYCILCDLVQYEDGEVWVDCTEPESKPKIAPLDREKLFAVSRLPDGRHEDGNFSLDTYPLFNLMRKINEIIKHLNA